MGRDGNGVLLGRRLKSVHQRPLVFQQIQGGQKMNGAWGRCAILNSWQSRVLTGTRKRCQESLLRVGAGGTLMVAN